MNLSFSIVFAFLVSFSLANDVVVSVSGEKFFESDFYLDFQKSTWDSADSLKKTQMVDEFLSQKVFSLEAASVGLSNNPKVRRDAINKKNKLIIDEAYDVVAVAPLIPENLLVSAKQHLKKERLVKHILLGFSGCKLPGDFSLTKEDALEKAVEIKNLFLSGVDFDLLVEEHSDDPGAKSGGGALGWFRWGQFEEPFQSAVFNSEVHKLSDPVLTKYGYHLVFVDGERPSVFSVLDSIYYGRASYINCKKFVSEDIPSAINQYETSVLKDNHVVFNDGVVFSVFDELKSNSNHVSGRTQLSSGLNNVVGSPVICSINGKGYGPKWFADWLIRFSYAQRPNISSVEELQGLFKTIILQRLILDNGLDLGLFEDPFVQSEYNKYVDKALQVSFVEHIESSVNTPDSSDVVSYYDKNKGDKYYKGDEVVIREIKVETQSVADSLYGLLELGGSFDVLAKNNSLTNPENGGIVGPFPKGRYNKVGRKAFELGLFEFCKPFKNLNRTWSIVMPIELLKDRYVPLASVYENISAKLRDIKKEQDINDAFMSLKKRYGVTINNSIFEEGE